MSPAPALRSSAPGWSGAPSRQPGDALEIANRRLVCSAWEQPALELGGHAITVFLVVDDFATGEHRSENRRCASATAHLLCLPDYPLLQERPESSGR